MPNISRSKGNQTTKFGQLIAWEIFFFRNHAEHEAGRLVPDLFVFEKIFVEGKSKWLAP